MSICRLHHIATHSVQKEYGLYITMWWGRQISAAEFDSTPHFHITTGSFHRVDHAPREHHMVTRNMTFNLKKSQHLNSHNLSFWFWNLHFTNTLVVTAHKSNPVLCLRRTRVFLLPAFMRVHTERIERRHGQSIDFTWHHYWRDGERKPKCGYLHLAFSLMPNSCNDIIACSNSLSLRLRKLGGSSGTIPLLLLLLLSDWLLPLRELCCEPVSSLSPLIIDGLSCGRFVVDLLAGNVLRPKLKWIYTHDLLHFWNSHVMHQLLFCLKLWRWCMWCYFVPFE